MSERHLPGTLDYHVHTNFSCDSKTTMVTVCDMAVLRGIDEIVFTDHADFEPLDECTGYLRADAYMAEIRRCQFAYGDDLIIRAGVEVGEGHLYPDAVADLLASYEFDFVLGSLHWVHGRPAFNGRYFKDQGLEEGLRTYFEDLARLVAGADFDVLAHFDIVRRAVYRVYGLRTLDYTSFEETIRRVLRTLVKRGKGLEINTSNSHRGMGDPNPTPQVLRWYREEGGEILTVGSDAHVPDAVGLDYDRALDWARAAGFTRLARFEKRQVRWIEI